MSEFDDIIRGALEVLESVFAGDVVYTLADGSSNTVTADLRIDADDFQEVERGENRVKSGLLIGSTAVFGDWGKDDTVTKDGTTWQFDREEGRDAALVRIRLSEAETTRRVAVNDRVRKGR